MTNHDHEELVKLAEYQERQCNRHVNGYCLTLRCMKRGGWHAGGDMNVATCEEHETAQALRREAPAAEPRYAAGFEACRKAAKEVADHHAIGNGDEFDDADIGGCTTAMAISDAITDLTPPAAAESNASVEARLREALKKIEYASRKDSLTDCERIQCIRAVVDASLSAVGDEAKKSEGGVEGHARSTKADSVRGEAGSAPSKDGSLAQLAAGVKSGPSDPTADRREIVAQELRRFHRNSCYPDASDGEVAIGVKAILAALDGCR